MAHEHKYQFLASYEIDLGGTVNSLYVAPTNTISIEGSSDCRIDISICGPTKYTDVQFTNASNVNRVEISTYTEYIMTYIVVHFSIIGYGDFKSEIAHVIFADVELKDFDIKVNLVH